MQVNTLHSPRPEIRFHRSGLIDVFSAAFRKLDLSDSPAITFVIDKEQNIYIQKSADGMQPSASKGTFLRYHSVKVTEEVFAHPDVPDGLSSVAFRTGQLEDDFLPIITRHLIR